MQTPGTQQAQAFQTRLPPTMNNHYLLYLPEGYHEQPDDPWPFILFLHGAGERGNQIQRVSEQGLPKLLRNERNFPFVVVSPQCSTSGRWDTDSLNAILDEMVATYNIDQNRIYVTGISMGGFGTWALAIAYPQRFAAIAPICGGGNANAVCAIKHLPVWTFHGAKDTVVPISRTEAMVQALKKCGGLVRFTIYPQAGHDSWTQTYQNPHLYHWFLEQRKGAASAS